MWRIAINDAPRYFALTDRADHSTLVWFLSDWLVSLFLGSCLNWSYSARIWKRICVQRWPNWPLNCGTICRDHEKLRKSWKNTWIHTTNELGIALWGGISTGKSFGGSSKAKLRVGSLKCIKFKRDTCYPVDWLIYACVCVCVCEGASRSLGWCCKKWFNFRPT